MEEINRKVSTQFKQLELAEKETARIITRNKKSEIAKQLQHVQLKLGKLKGFKYLAHKVLFEEGEMGNLEEWPSVMEKKIARFDDAADRLKS